jgi:hypothetical protein
LSTVPGGAIPRTVRERTEARAARDYPVTDHSANLLFNTSLAI